MEMTDAQKQQLTGVLRALLAYGIGRLVGAHIIDSQLGDEIIGVVLMLAPVAWGWVERRLSAKKTDAKIADGVNTGITLADPAGIVPLKTVAEAKAAVAEIAPTLPSP